MGTIGRSGCAETLGFRPAAQELHGFAAGGVGPYNTPIGDEPCHMFDGQPAFPVGIECKHAKRKAPSGAGNGTAADRRRGGIAGKAGEEVHRLKLQLHRETGMLAEGIFGDRIHNEIGKLIIRIAGRKRFCLYAGSFKPVLGARRLRVEKGCRAAERGRIGGLLDLVARTGVHAERERGADKRQDGHYGDGKYRHCAARTGSTESAGKQSALCVHTALSHRHLKATLPEIDKLNQSCPIDLS